MGEGKSRISLTILAGLTITFIAGYLIAILWPIKVNPQCPDKLKAYCTDWNVENSDVADKDEHLLELDEFSIRATSKGIEPPIWLKAKSSLENRWKGQKKIKLREIEDGGNVQCMVGRVNLSHDSQDHDWHQITFRVETDPTEAGEEILAMCVTKRDNGDWPNQCRIDDCAAGPQMHGGRAHARD